MADALSAKLGTTVSIGRVDLGLLNRIIIDDVLVLDQQHKKMLQASRLSAKVELLPLMQGRIVVNSAQFFGTKALLYKATADSPTNFQFVLDSLASKDTTKHTPLDLKVNSLIVRHGSVSYDDLWMKSTPGVFNTHHLKVSDLSVHIILNHLTDSLLDVNVKKVALREASGLQLDNLHLELSADHRQARLKNFHLELPHSRIDISDIKTAYATTASGKLDKASLKYSGTITRSQITLSDISCFLPLLKHYSTPLQLAADFDGTASSARVSRLSLTSDDHSIRFLANGKVDNMQTTAPSWQAKISDFTVTPLGMKHIASVLPSSSSLPEQLFNLGTISLKADANGCGKDVDCKALLSTDAGNAKLALLHHDSRLKASLTTDDINVGRITGNKMFGSARADLQAEGTTSTSSRLPLHLSTLSLNGNVNHFGYNGHDYKNISVDGRLADSKVSGTASIDDELVNFEVSGSYALNSHHYDVDAQLYHLQPSKVLGMKTKDPNFSLENISIIARNQADESYVDLQAPFAQAHVNGKFDYTTLVQSVANLIADKLPTVPGLHKSKTATNNNFDFSATLYDADWLTRMFGVSLNLIEPVSLNGNINDRKKQLNLSALLPDFYYDGMHFRGGDIDITTPRDTLLADIAINKMESNGTQQSLRLHSSAANNTLTTLLNYDNHSRKLPLRGRLLTDTYFFVNDEGHDAAHLAVHTSNVQVGDSVWTIEPSDIVYSQNRLLVDHFSIHHGSQHLSVNGLATKSQQDSLLVDLQGIDVAYILNLVNFHSVDFTGYASGKACVAGAFGKPSLSAALDVEQFTFEGGEMGTLHALADYDTEAKRINIDAVADDGPEAQTVIKGYIAPASDDILLGIDAHGTKMQFVEEYTKSFMSDIEGNIYGHVDLVGPLSKVNLQGDVRATGRFHMNALNTDYHFENVHITAVPEEITFATDTIYDRNGNIAIVNGGLHHKHLTRLSYDIDVKASNFLGFDTHDFGDNTFYGTVYATGNVGIHGKSGETIIDVDAQPGANSIIVYNAASPDAISDQSFIHWRDVTDRTLTSAETVQKNGKKGRKTSVEAAEEIQQVADIPSDMRINFLVNANKDLTLKVMMDNETGDYITLNGDGVIKANWFNKGSFDMFGNYVVDHGTYRLTVQNVIRKDFTFERGGTIAFGGDAFDAALNLTAKYTVNGVSLADLQIGRSFSSNNIRVDCLMNITGTPGAPKVDFTFDMPTVSNDAKQMVTSIINSEEEMNQQVLYLLAVGRFYAQSNNNSLADGSQQQSQTSLAMQSLLSGTISQQLNNVLSSVVNNNNWNFGANISTGDEGFYNAEYEGLLSGRLFNNRLLFNGQFGYRDNNNATTSFIGDFDLSYLLLPNGNLALKVYNQTNDRYFTRNSLNTQGIGVMMKKDFSGFRDLFGFGKKKKKKADSKKAKASLSDNK